MTGIAARSGLSIGRKALALPEERSRFWRKHADEKPDRVTDPAEQCVQRNLLRTPSIREQPIDDQQRAPSFKPRCTTTPHYPPNEGCIQRIQQ